MIPLSSTLRKNGFTYTLVLREGRSCIYRQRVTENLNYYEVFTVQVKPDKNLFGKSYPAKEVFPGNENFGRNAWSCRTFEQAKIRFDRLVMKEVEMNKSIINAGK